MGRRPFFVDKSAISLDIRKNGERFAQNVQKSIRHNSKNTRKVTPNEHYSSKTLSYILVYKYKNGWKFIYSRRHDFSCPNIRLSTALGNREKALGLIMPNG